jgi:anaerobic ribonucleoside-triphosphate reductase activating protein
MTQLPPSLRIAALTPLTYCNGPGPRALIHVQGCTRHCLGCGNAAMQDPQGGAILSLRSLIHWLLRLGPRRGLSISGGEPQEQATAVKALLQALRKVLPTWDSVLFTGYAPEEWAPEQQAVAALCDCVIAGPFRQELTAGHTSYLASTNQQLLLASGRITAAEMSRTEWELVVPPAGGLALRGFPPATWLEQLSRFKAQLGRKAHCSCK